MTPSYFSEESGNITFIFYGVATTLTAVLTVISFLAPLIAPACDRVSGPDTFRARSGVEYLNVDYSKDPCKFDRYAVLLGMTKWEADMSARVVFSLIMGSTIGWERRRADRPAGIRTMAMVCMGACVFTIDSVYAFWDGPMNWDSSRVSAAIPSGVGFLGAAAIWKGSAGKDGSSPAVFGLTTATSVWLSAAIGILAGGAIYVPATFATMSSIVYLRFAPRLSTSCVHVTAPSHVSRTYPARHTHTRPRPVPTLLSPALRARRSAVARAPRALGPGAHRTSTSKKADEGTSKEMQPAQPMKEPLVKKDLDSRKRPSIHV